MPEYIETFARMEKKYSMNKEQFNKLLREIGDRIEPDLYPRSVVNSIYFDTPDHKLIRRSLDKPMYKEKLRLRSYGGPVSPDTAAFAEIKKKYNGCVYKRRVDGKYQELMSWLCGEGPCPGDSQIHREIDYFISLNRSLAPAMQIAYKRLAYVLKEDHSIRVTFDTDILFRDRMLKRDGSAYGTRLIDKDTILMEIKVSSKAIPVWLIRAVEKAGIQPSSISKYGTAYVNTCGNGNMIVPQIYEQRKVYANA